MLRLAHSKCLDHHHSSIQVCFFSFLFFRFMLWITLGLFSLGDPNSQEALKHLDSTKCSTLLSFLVHEAGKEKRRDLLRIKERE